MDFLAANLTKKHLVIESLAVASETARGQITHQREHRYSECVDRLGKLLSRPCAHLSEHGTQFVQWGDLDDLAVGTSSRNDDIKASTAGSASWSSCRA